MSDIKLHEDNLKLVENLLDINDYPPKFHKNFIKNRLHYCSQKFKKSFQSNNEIIQCEDNQIVPKYFLQLPFLKDFYYKFPRILENAILLLGQKLFIV